MLSSADIITWFRGLQDDICGALEALDGPGRFIEDVWERSEGGGGRSRVITGRHIAKGGVNWSAVHGPMPEKIAKGLGLPPNDFLATGISIVLHPTNPHIPIIHMNVRYFETSSGSWWFGGGIDLTPHYVVPELARDFHTRLEQACSVFNDGAYREYKKWADDYFYNDHRQETRGIGGIFFDRLNEDSGHSKDECWRFVQEVGMTFVPAYTAQFSHGISHKWTTEEQQWQHIRRGRYVEFNLVYDRGTKFGLQTNGRIESILMSLPPHADWVYNHVPPQGGPESDTLSFLRKGIDWINYTAE